MATLSSTDTTPPSPPTFSPHPSSTPSPGPTQQCSAMQVGCPSSGTLYLLTFLVTLSLLILLTGCCVGRGYYRRRLRARGLLPPGGGAAQAWGRARDRDSVGDAPPKPPPRLYDVYLDVKRATATGQTWDTLLPFAASYVPAHAPFPAPDTKPAPAPAEAPALAAESALMSGAGAVSIWGLALAAVRHLRHAYALRRARRPAPADVPLQPLPSSAPAPVEPLHARVACVVAMPVPPAHVHGDESEGEDEPPPYMELGLADVEIVHVHVRVEGADEGEGEGKGGSAGAAPEP